MSAEIDNTPSGNELTRYLVSVMALERKLASRRDSMAQLGDRISTAKRQLEHFELLDEQMVSNLANIYLDIISPLGPRIQVTGTPAHLQQPSVQHKVRALLLAAVRGAVLVASGRRQTTSPDLWPQTNGSSKQKSCWPAAEQIHGCPLLR